jgi:hypothetical protein
VSADDLLLAVEHELLAALATIRTLREAAMDEAQEPEPPATMGQSDE